MLNSGHIPTTCFWLPPQTQVLVTREKGVLPSLKIIAMSDGFILENLMTNSAFTQFLCRWACVPHFDSWYVCSMGGYEEFLWCSKLSFNNFALLVLFSVVNVVQCPLWYSLCVILSVYNVYLFQWLLSSIAHYEIVYVWYWVFILLNPCMY
jgi:hypothetical protein